MLFLFTALGCALGGVVRYLTMTLLTRKYGGKFPWGLLLVNTLGSGLLGLYAGLTSADSSAWVGGAATQAFFVVGFCGGLTTFSTFSLENIQMVSKKAWGQLAWQVFGSVGICLFAVLGGYLIGGGKW